MTHHPDQNTIEAEIERDRASLASTLDALQDRVSVEHLAQEALGMIRTNAATFTHSIDSAVRANPMALALTGVGLAWLVFGSRKPDTKPVKPASISRWEDEGGNLAPQNPSHATSDHDWLRNVDALRGKASAKLRRMEKEARTRANDPQSGVSGALGKARDHVAEQAAVLAEFAQDMKRSFVHGLEDLSDAARDHIVQTRERAYAARLRTERAVTVTARDAGRLIEDHPMVAGVIALAMGAAFAVALPRTRTEDRSFGTERDHLMDEAARLLRQERHRISSIAEGVKEDLQESAKEAMGEMSKTLAEAAGQVKERPEVEASGRPQNGTGAAPPKPADQPAPKTTASHASPPRRIG